MRALFSFLLFATVLPAAAQSPLTVDGGVAFRSTYAWRGYEVAGAPSVQPNLTFSLDQGLWFDVWGAYAAADRDEWRDADEVDFTVGYDHEIEFGPSDVWMSAGYVYYAFPRLDGENATQEVFAAVGIDALLQPSLNLYYDFDLVDAWYVSPGVSHSLWFGPGFGPALDLSLSVGFTDQLLDDQGEAAFGWQDVTLGASMDLELGSVVVTPEFGYSIADASINPDRSMVWGGMRIGFGF